MLEVNQIIMTLSGDKIVDLRISWRVTGGTCSCTFTGHNTLLSWYSSSGGH